MITAVEDEGAGSAAGTLAKILTTLVKRVCRVGRYNDSTHRRREFVADLLVVRAAPTCRRTTSSSPRLCPRKSRSLRPHAARSARRPRQKPPL